MSSQDCSVLELSSLTLISSSVWSISWAAEAELVEVGHEQFSGGASACEPSSSSSSKSAILPSME
jgi:hypothetical protein